MTSLPLLGACGLLTAFAPPPVAFLASTERPGARVTFTTSDGAVREGEVRPNGDVILDGRVAARIVR